MPTDDTMSEMERKARDFFYDKDFKFGGTPLGSLHALRLVTAFALSERAAAKAEEREECARDLEESYPDNPNTNAFCAAIRARAANGRAENGRGG
jgi:hypothetical protein